MNIEDVKQEVNTVVNSNPTMDQLKELRNKLFGYKPRGVVRDIRTSLYNAFNAAEKRSAEKKDLKEQIRSLKEWENATAEQLDNLIVAKSDEEKAAKLEAKRAALEAKRAAKNLENTESTLPSE